ncbi:MAG: hypothetical protein KAT05_09095 [Spirochaetes bacterium]|nr:hypothetical protein [Spirochaetota bacterium]
MSEFLGELKSGFEELMPDILEHIDVKGLEDFMKNGLKEFDDIYLEN